MVPDRLVRSFAAASRALHPSPCVRQVLLCLRQAERRKFPYSYWLLDKVLPEWVIDAITALPCAPPVGAVFDGRRESNNSSRFYFNPEAQQRFPVCREVAQAFRSNAVQGALRAATGQDLSQGQLRIEYCLDVDGFWLEPHLDISVKLFTMLVYLSADPALHDAGTDIYDGSPEHRAMGRAPYRRNGGLIFIPGADSWHGFSKRPIRGLRSSLIINFVTPDWRNRDELA